jgi:hypothetical protein
VLIAKLFGWKVQALDIAALSSLAAITAPVTTWAVARLQLRKERKARIYPDQREAYAAMLKDSYRGLSTLLVLVDEIDAGSVEEAQELMDNLVTDTRDQQADRLAIAALFSPDGVWDLFTQILGEWNAVAALLDDASFKIDTAENRKAAAAKLGTEIASMRATLTNLRRALRDDLGE